jgi:hypothetical protein
VELSIDKSCSYERFFMDVEKIGLKEPVRKCDFHSGRLPFPNATDKQAHKDGILQAVSEFFRQNKTNNGRKQKNL